MKTVGLTFKKKNSASNNPNSKQDKTANPKSNSKQDKGTEK